MVNLTIKGRPRGSNDFGFVLVALAIVPIGHDNVLTE